MASGLNQMYPWTSDVEEGAKMEAEGRVKYYDPLVSIAISLKRLADVAERITTPPNREDTAAINTRDFR